MIKIQSTKTPILLALSILTFSFAAGCSSSKVGAPDTSSDQSLVATFGGQSIDLAEFEQEYARTAGAREIAAQDSMPLYADFLDRYVDYRLKVMYARELGFDRDSSLLGEIETYRKQLARPYLLEKEILDPILHDLYQRRQTMVDASHILVRVGRLAPQEKVDSAYTKISAIKDSLDQGLDFGDLAYRNSEDPSARGNRVGAKGRLGYFIGGQMVKDFEDRAYTTPVDSVSDIFRSDFGFHIMKVHDRRPKVPDVWASHIAVRHFMPAGGDTLDSEQRIAKLLERLNNGEDFATVAREGSEDRDTGSRGGQIGRLAYTQQGMPDEFKEALFSLENPGDYSGIVRTEYGYHIIKLDRREEPQTFEEAYDELKTFASRLPRLKKAETEMAARIREQYGTNVDTTSIVEILNGRHFGASDILETPADHLDTIVASIGDQSFTFRNIVNFAKSASIPFQPDTLALALDAVNRFLDDEALNYEASQLETRDAEFKNILDEFKSGLLLFKLMEDSVWTAAAQDTAGLMAYHSPRADSFWFKDRNRIISLRSSADSLLQDYTSQLDEGVSLSDLLAIIQEDSTSSVSIDTTYLEGPNNSMFDQALKLEVGEHTDPMKMQNSYVVMINDGVEPARQKTFEEARSEILNAYQTIVENDLLARLRQKYHAQKFPQKLRAAFATEKLAIVSGPEVHNDDDPAPAEQ